MSFNGLVLNIVSCALMETLTSILLPEGRMKKFTMSIIAIFLFFSIVYPLCNFLLDGGIESLVVDLF